MSSKKKVCRMAGMLLRVPLRRLKGMKRFTGDSFARCPLRAKAGVRLRIMADMWRRLRCISGGYHWI